MTRNQRKAARRAQKLSRHARRTFIPWQVYETATDIFLDKQSKRRHARTSRILTNIKKQMEEAGRPLA